jgi:hypothetical protein
MLQRLVEPLEDFEVWYEGELLKIRRGVGSFFATDHEVVRKHPEKFGVARAIVLGGARISEARQTKTARPAQKTRPAPVVPSLPVHETSGPPIKITLGSGAKSMRQQNSAWGTGIRIREGRPTRRRRITGSGRSSSTAPRDLDNWRRRVWDKATEASGVEATIYDLRHSYCSLLIHEGRSVPVRGRGDGARQRCHDAHALRAHVR